MNFPSSHLARLFLSLFVILVTTGIFYGKQSMEQKIERLKNRETDVIQNGANALSKQVEFIQQDVTYFARHAATRTAIEHPTTDNLTFLADDFEIFLGSHPYYSKIRWIDATGMERVRANLVNGQARRVPPALLQDKSQRYFFTDTMRLHEGEIFISPLDLNVDQGQIEVPYKPTLRVATPLANAQGKPAGILVLNYDGSALLQAFTLATERIADHQMLLNHEGYWLNSTNAANEWGFMFQHPELRLATHSPAAWAQLQQRDNGQVELEDGLWTWQTVRLPQNHSLSPPPPLSQQSGMAHSAIYWKSVSHLSAEELRDIRLTTVLNVGSVSVLLLVLLGLGYRLASQIWGKLNAAQVKYQTVADFTLDWELWITPDGHLEYCSAACQTITGYAAQAFMHDPDLLLSITHPDEQEMLRAHQLDIHLNQRSCHLTFRILHLNGEIRWLEHVCQPVFDPSGEFIGRRASNRDITEQKRAAEAQTWQARNVQALLNAIQETAFLVARDGTLLVINEVGAHRLNATPQALVGKNVYDFLPADVAHARRARFEAIALAKQPARYEDQRADYRFLSNIYPIPDDQGEVTRFAVYATDITQQHRQQAIETMLFGIGQEILQGMPLHEIFTDVCEKLAELFNVELVWIGRKESDGVISVLAAAGSAIHYIEQLKVKGVRWDDTPQGNGPTGTAIRTEKIQWFRVDDPNFQLWGNIARDNHLQTILAIPLPIRDEVYGAFTLYSKNLRTR